MSKRLFCWHVANRATAAGLSRALSRTLRRPWKCFPLQHLRKSRNIATHSNLKCAKVLTRFPSSGKFIVIRFAIDGEALAPPDPPPEIRRTFDCVSLPYKVAPQRNELFIICRRFASLKKITFCSDSGRPPHCTLGGNAFKRTGNIREEERRDVGHAEKSMRLFFWFHYSYGKCI